MLFVQTVLLLFVTLSFSVALKLLKKKKSDYQFLLLSLDRGMICLTFMEYKGAHAKHEYPQNFLPEM